MRTTLDLDDVVLEAARALAASRGSSVGKVISELALAGLRPRRADDVGPMPGRPAFPQFASRADAKPLTGEDVRRALDDEIPGGQ
jgi:hypothetical protein